MARYECPGCGYVYDETRGDAHEGFPSGTPWKSVPMDWSCPSCAVRDKPDFIQLIDTPDESATS